MIPVVRAIAVYGFLLVLMRLMGKRSLAQVTVFDLLVLLIVSEATQQGMTGNDFSVTNSIILVTTLVLLQRAADKLTNRSPRSDRLLNDVPTVIVQDGRPIADRMRHNDLSDGELLEEVRKAAGLEGLDKVRYAVLERDGSISVIQSG
ncbi:MAG TPA: YetF domain-containing protein [Solirubrobacteraceae bacterium]|nr:YetF domain-containing protein [Solirubrobacteraceae bacterium]